MDGHSKTSCAALIVLFKAIFLPPTVSVADVDTSSETHVYFPSSFRVTSDKTSLCTGPSVTILILFVSRTGFPFFIHFTDLSGFESSHSRVAPSFSKDCTSESGFLNSAGSSEMKFESD